MIETATEQDLAPGDPAQVLSALRSEHDAANAAEARKLALAVDWAAMHPPESIDDALGWPTRGTERAIPVGGDGVPWVAEFCLADLAAAMSMSTDAARCYLAAALELAHRLPRTYARVMDGSLPA